MRSISENHRELQGTYQLTTEFVCKHTGSVKIVWKTFNNSWNDPFKTIFHQSTLVLEYSNKFDTPFHSHSASTINHMNLMDFHRYFKLICIIYANLCIIFGQFVLHIWDFTVIHTFIKFGLKVCFKFKHI